MVIKFTRVPFPRSLLRRLPLDLFPASLNTTTSRASSMATGLPELSSVEQLSPLVVRILGHNPSKYTLQGTNTYLVGNGPKRILIDTGEGKVEWRDRLRAVLEAQKCSIDKCILTHWHGDHVRGVPDLLSLCPGAKIYKYPGGPKLDFPDTETRSTSSIEKEHPGGRPLPQTEPMKDGEIFSTGGASIQVVHAPGHTVDHCGLVLHEEDEALFSGDAILGHGTAVFEDLGVYMNGLATLKQACGPNARIYPAHGAIIPNGRAKVQEYINHRHQREQEVLGVLRDKGGSQSVTAMEIVKVVYKNYPEALHAPAEGGTRLVLRKMEAEGKVVEDADGRWRIAREAAL